MNIRISLLLAVAMGWAMVSGVSADGVDVRSLLWAAEPGWLGNPAASPAVAKTTEGMRFTVSQPGKGMKWSASLPQKIDLSKLPWVVLRYRAIDAVPPIGYFVWLNGSEEQFIFQPSDFTADGAWHTIVARAKPGTASIMAVQLQASGSKAMVEISRLELLGSPPEMTPEDLLATGKVGPGKFRTLDVSSLCDTGPQEVMQALSLSRWLPTGDIAVSGVPFKILSGARSIAATDADRPSVLRIPVNARCSEVFLLIASTSSKAGSFGEVNEPHQFSATVSYSNGPSEQMVPARMPGGWGLAPKFAVYALPVSGKYAVKDITVRDNLSGVTLNLVAATAGIDTRLAANARPAAVCGARPYVPVRHAESNWEAERLDRNGRQGLQMSDGRNVVVLNLRPEVSVSIPAQTGQRLTGGGSLWTVRIDDRELRSTDFEGTVVESYGANAAIELIDRHNLGIRGLLSITSSTEVLLQLELGPADRRRMQVDFPTLPSLRHAGGADLAYCFPRRGSVVNSRPIELREAYSGSMPLQFMDAYGRGGGIYLMTHDRDAVFRYFLLRKDSSGVAMSVEYPEKEYDSSSRFRSVVSAIGFHAGDWHAALDAYRAWLGAWYKPDAPRKDWFRRVFNFRQQFMRFYIPGGEKYFDKSTKKYTFPEGIAEDVKEFGGVDYLHIFDWGASEKRGRCGDYEPWDEIGGVDAFHQAVKQTQDAGIPVGLYIEGYLIDPPSKIAQAHGKEWEILDAQGKPLPFFAPAMNMCSAVEGWQDYLAAVYERVSKQTGAMGYYCDEMGFADPGHFCYATDHGHAIPEPPTRGQRDLLRKVRRALGPDAALYTEETPIDSGTIHQDGSFTYAISSVSDAWSPSHVNLARFALPDFKTFEIITCDHPIGDMLTPVRRIFFNGEGIWIEGPPTWFAPEVRAFIRKMHGVMRKYADCFTSLSPVPLVPTGQKMVYANQFPGSNRVLWTLFNANYSTVRGELLAVAHTPGAKYYDAWNNHEIKPRIDKGIAYLNLELGPRDVGCVVRRSKK